MSLIVKVPEADVDDLITKEEFVSTLEDMVTSENARILGVSARVVAQTTSKVSINLVNILALLGDLVDTEYEPLAIKVAEELGVATGTLDQLVVFFKEAEAVAEATYVTKH